MGTSTYDYLMALAPEGRAPWRLEGHSLDSITLTTASKTKPVWRIEYTESDGSRWHSPIYYQTLQSAYRMAAVTGGTKDARRPRIHQHRP